MSSESTIDIQRRYVSLLQDCKILPSCELNRSLRCSLPMYDFTCIALTGLLSEARERVKPQLLCRKVFGMKNQHVPAIEEEVQKARLEAAAKLSKNHGVIVNDILKNSGIVRVS